MSFPFKVLWFLAAAHLLLGLLAVLLGIADVVTHVQANPGGGFEASLLAAPIWCGIPFVVAGGLGLAVSPYKPNVQEQTRQHWICCMINSVLFGPVMFIIAMVDLFLEVQTSSILDRDISFEIGFIIISVLEIWCALGSVTIYCMYKAPRQVKEPKEGEFRLSPFSLVARHCTVCSAYCKRRRHPDKNSWVTDDDTEVVITSSGAGHHGNESGVQPIPEDASPEEKELFLVARRLEEENVRLQKQLKVNALKEKVKKLQQNNRALSHKLNKVQDGDSASIMIKDVAPSSTQVHHGKTRVHDGKERQQQAALSDKSQQKQAVRDKNRATSAVKKGNLKAEGVRNPDKLDAIDESQNKKDDKAEINCECGETAEKHKQKADKEKPGESQSKKDGKAETHGETKEPDTQDHTPREVSEKSKEQTTTADVHVEDTQDLSPEREEEIRLKLKEAQTSNDANEIKKAITEFQDAKLEDFSEDLPAAQKQLKVLELKAALDKAISNRQLSKIGTVLAEIKKRGLQDVMSNEVARANKMLILIKQMDKLRQEVLNIKQSTIAEIRSYKNASEPVHKVMTATFLLLGENEKDIKEWSALKTLVGKSGKDGLKQRVEHCDVAKIPVAMATKVQEMLVPFRLEEVRDHSAGAAAFFLWANGMADEVLEGAA
ncbi:M protein, serotype 2.1-like isoform X1 [Branchiostoma lanceolatum]|uniref:M protein, serotype 2.1-like isoform X1 n=1 Tax=Branchiostoma lanceolatum TaxID=7740 RepID=UPI0034512512